MRRVLWLLAAVLVAGCASPPGPPPLRPGEVTSAADALGILKGARTREQVRGLLGEPQSAIAFDSGYEVWVYRQQLREKQAPPRPELVLLFTPQSVLAKTRIKMPP
jgi:outer membrane protein assembly factor BamE (lipoprotein component of BamABCDE complex)